MSTVPTLTIGGTDQTDYILHKSFDVKLKTLDVTLIDPVDNPALHDAVSVDTPAWTGRVSTIEATPYHTTGGDHRYLKITCTNKHTAADDAAPFGLSDTPDNVTTFPYRDFTYTQTLADQTDLASAEHRASCIVYEEGLVPGMTVEVTNDAEGLAAEAFIITEITVEWLRDDVATYRLDMSVEGVPPVTLGDIIDSAGCDCAPYVCNQELDFYLTDLPLTQLSCIVNPSNPSGDTGCRTDNDNSPARTVMLYAAATYKVRYSVYHGPNSWHIGVSMLDNIGHNIFMWDAGGYNGTPGYPVSSAQPLSEWIYGSPPNDHTYAAFLHDFPRAGRDSIDSSVFAEVVYVSGGDPRFVDLPACAEPHTGQLVLDGSFDGDGIATDFSTVWPYGENTLMVDVNGLDWTKEITESDPTTGEYTLSYPPPLGSTVTPRYRGA